MTRRFYRRLCLALAVVFAALLALSLSLEWIDSNYGVWLSSGIKIKRDRESRFQLDPGQPYEISVSELGLPNLNSEEVTIRHDGRVVTRRSGRIWDAYRSHREFRDETSTFILQSEALAQILDAIEANQLMRLHRRYEDTDTFDGVRWGIRIKQGQHEKQISCSNYFPEGVTKFKAQLKAILAPYQAGLVWREAEHSPR